MHLMTQNAMQGRRHPEANQAHATRDLHNKVANAESAPHVSLIAWHNVAGVHLHCTANACACA